MPENTNTATAEAQGEEQIETTAVVAAPPDGDTPATAETADAGDGEADEEREQQPERIPLKEFKDADGVEWVRLYRGTKVVLLRRKSISAMTMDEEEGDPLIHLENAKDVIAVDRDGWCALNTSLFGEYKD